MTAALPLWASLLVSLLVVGGAALTLIGSIGLVRAQTFYDRAHPPSMGSTLGMSGILFGSMVYFSVTGGRVSVHEILLIIFVPIVAPVTMMLLARAALFRDRSKGYDEQRAAAQRAADELAQAQAEAALRPDAPPEPTREPPAGPDEDPAEGTDPPAERPPGSGR